MGKLTKTMIDVLFPPRCAICDGVVEIGETICSDCRHGLPYIEKPTCMRCGKEVAGEEQEYCKDCSSKNRTFIKGYPVFNYVPPIVDSLMAYKYNGRQEYAAFYSREIIKKYGNAFRQIGIDAVVPIPIHNSKYTTRGYNQAELIAEPVSEWLEVPMISDLLSRDTDTMPQKELGSSKREKNLKGAFGINKRALEDSGIKGGIESIRSILLVDDIYTTGATVQTCTELLYSVGVEKVYYTAVAIGKGDS